MNIEIIIYSIFCIIISLMLVLSGIFVNEKPEYTTRYYKYKVKYDVDLDKYYSMLNKQKKVIRNKKLELFYLKLLLKIKGVR